MTRRASVWLRCLGVVAALLGPDAIAADLRQYHERPLLTYRSADPAFSLQVPADWVSSEAAAPVRAFIHAKDLLPALRIIVLDEPWWLPLSFATTAAKTQLAELGSDIELVDERLETWDGLRVNVGEVNWTMAMGSGIALRTLFVSAFIEDRWVMLNLVAGAGDGELPEELNAIAQSLRSSAADDS